MSKDIKERISNSISEDRVVLFMKGTRDTPMCGFSAKVVEMLNSLQVEYKTYDVISDADLRSGIKEFSNWPTLPQLYIGGEFVGGCDICVEMFENGELAQKLND
ncbi:MAG TPA: Grx4 family monothiol glutaredoxin [Candidatus Dadabacteria bacterium]|jgi:monothiol glutaredoxin|nr:Grx4 family monothiol glutaredoxin [Candidatus Dadabacteria bacterium]